MSATAQPLLTQTSAALSLSPPRAPPHGSASRSMYHRTTMPLHPHLPASPSLPDRATRFIGTALPLHIQHSLRDTGGLRSLVDSMATLSCPLVGVAGRWEGARDFLALGRLPCGDGDDGGDCGRGDDDDGVASSSSSRAEGGMDSPGGEAGGGGDGGRFNRDARGRGGRGDKRGWTRRRIPYGDRHPMQYVDLYLPSSPLSPSSSSSPSYGGAGGGTSVAASDDDDDDDDDKRVPVRGTVFFVHGGAWGSGMPWMYRLVAHTFLTLGFAVAIVGYRTYPDAPDIDEQAGDVSSAWEACGAVLGGRCRATTTTGLATPSLGRRNGVGGRVDVDDADDVDDDEVGDCGDGDDDVDGRGWVGNVIMGHSSGAHVAMLALVDWIGNRRRRRRATKTADASRGSEDSSVYAANPTNRVSDDKKYPWTPDFFVGLSGPYDISHHFDYEAGRGVEQISPMKPICGHTRENFRSASPVHRFLSLLRDDGGDDEYDDGVAVQRLAPPILLVHGMEDSTVPFTATADAGRTLRSCGLTRCDEIYLDGTGHQDVIMHFMFGGLARDLVLNWILRCRRGARLETNTSQIRSRL